MCGRPNCLTTMLGRGFCNVALEISQFCCREWGGATGGLLGRMIERPFRNLRSGAYFASRLNQCAMRCRYDSLKRCLHAIARLVSCAWRWNDPFSFAEPDERHISVDSFMTTGRNTEGLVEYADCFPGV